ncbi:helix-turn-helix transcriptional regulator [uncultured Alistipes sp.]|uniref:helix-turn-helix transcriptional regulator n=1 Tax=uncultured Alistipes sp. TaxID=538949 RepID=UPI0025E78A4C|nr:helix-turn-helix transcriptional regulator [uncultured Alistipes sp.]
MHRTSIGEAVLEKSEVIGGNNDLYIRLEELLKDHTVYADPKLSRKSLADRLNTNETYLRETISQHTGLTFTEYITGYRLARACRLLRRTDYHYSPQEIADACGFGSISTFYRLFRNRFGTTPEGLRSASKEL